MMCAKAYKEFPKNFAKSMLREKYEERIDKTAAVGHDGVNREVFRRDLEDELDVIARKSVNGTYRFTTYREKLLAKGPKKPPRVISIPTFRDRLTQKALLDVLTNVFCEVRPEIPQVKIGKVKEQIEQGAWDSFVKVDVKDFYPSIDHSILRTKLRRRIRKKEILLLIERAIETPTVSVPPAHESNVKGVPQGLSISNILAEIYLQDIEAEFLARGDCYVERYVDDWLILAMGKDVDNVARELVRKLSSLGLEAHPTNGEDGKTASGSLGQRFSFLGYAFVNRVATVRSASVNRLEGSIAKILTTAKYKLRTRDRDSVCEVCQWRLNLRITGCIFEGRRMGWLFYFSQIDDERVVHKLDATVSKLVKRFGFEGDIKTKSFVKAFYESKRKEIGNHQYIPNFDEMGIEEKRTILAKYFGFEKVGLLTEEKVEKFFAMRISKVAKELEEDILEFS